jgi:hypothetical protein
MVATRLQGRSNPWPGTDRQFDFEDDYDTVGKSGFIVSFFPSNVFCDIF